MKIYFVRHLKTKGNFERRYIGATDENISNLENQIIPNQLPNNPTSVYSSPLKRCTQTAKLIYQTHTLNIIEDLKEMDFGDFENKNYDELKENQNYRNFIDGLESPKNGEITADFRNRCVNAFLKIAQKNEDEIVIFTHGGTIMSILSRLDEKKKDFYDYQIPNGGVLVCNYNGKNLKILEGLI